jgi:hypothetical protein
MPIDEFSVKSRSGPPEDKRSDMDLSVWAGELPIRTRFGSPVPAPELEPDTPVPDYINRMIRRR